MSKLNEYRERFAAVIKEAKFLQEKEDRTADDESRITALIAEANELGPKLQREVELDAVAMRNAEFNEPAGRQVPNGGQPSEGAEQREQRDKAMPWSLGRRFAESDQLREARERNLRRSQPLEVRSFWPQHRAAIEHDDSMGPVEQRALIQTGGLPADYISAQQVPGFFRGEDLQGTLRSVLINGTTTSDAIVYFRELLFTNAAAGVAQATATAGASGLKPESAITFEQDTAPVVTIAHWIPITRQTLEDAGQIRTYVEQRLLDGLRLAESDQLLNGTGAPDLDGLLTTTGVQALDATYWTTAPVVDEGTNNENFNRIMRARTLIRTVGRARANFVVLNPTDMEAFLVSTDANQQYLGGGPFANQTINTLWGLRAVEDEYIAAGTALVGDGRMAAVWDRMQAQILVDTIDDQFVRNMLTLLAEERLALTVFRPAAFAEVTLAQ
jgi:HK97 family phage major capsid protein